MGDATKERVKRLETQMDRIEQLAKELTDEPGEPDATWTLEQRVQWLERRNRSLSDAVYRLEAMVSGEPDVDPIRTRCIEVLDNVGMPRVLIGQVDPDADPAYGIRVLAAADYWPYLQMATSNDGDADFYMSNGHNITLSATTYPIDGPAFSGGDGTLDVCDKEGHMYWSARSGEQLEALITALRGGANMVLGLTGSEAGDTGA